MGDDRKFDPKLQDLRRRAVRALRSAAEDRDASTLSVEQMQELTHELRIYQTELELQNEELRRAQIEIEASRDRYADLYDFSPVGYFAFDRRGRIVDVNLSGATLINQAGSSLIKKPFMTFVSANDHKTFYSHLRKAFETGVRRTCELQLERPGRTAIYVRMESVVPPRRGEEPQVCRTAISDITEAHCVREEVLRTQEQILSSMVEGVSVSDERGVVSNTNTAFDALFGASPGEMFGRSIADLMICSRDGEEAGLAVILSEAVAKGAWRGELRCSKRDGTPVDVDVRITPVHLFGRTDLIAVWDDVTALRQSQRALRESEYRLRTMFESTTDLILVKDRSLRYTMVNPAVEHLFGKPAASLLGLRYEDLCGKTGAAYEADVDHRVLQGAVIEEERTRSIKGIVRKYHEIRAPMRDTSGEIVGMWIIARDVTERRGVEQGSRPEFGKNLSESTRKAMHMALSAAKRGSVILLRGESGSGKDYFARYIHDHSDRSGGPYFSLNCAAISPTLAESELFGHERGAFTGAHSLKRGLLELAEGGTLLLNEIGELDLPLQSKLLTFLDTRKFTRVGGQKEISVNARLIAATNRDLEKEMKTGRFRQDLYYRLNVMTIEIPPLRQRTEEIPELVERIVAELASELQVTDTPRIDPSVIRAFMTYDWRGNIRELRNVLERLLILGEHPSFLDEAIVPQPGARDCYLRVRLGHGHTLRDAVDELTRSLCLEALKRSRGNKKEAARVLDISRDTLYKYLKDSDTESKPTETEIAGRPASTERDAE